jgi:DNA-binding transcriptional regulator YiaG
MMKAKDIKALRKTLNLTQKGLAEALGCKLCTVEHYEQGFRSPSEVFAARLEKLKKKADKMTAVDKTTK